MGRIHVRRMAAAGEQVVCGILGFAFADQPDTLAVSRGEVALARRIAFGGIRPATLGRTHRNLCVADGTGEGARIVNPGIGREFWCPVR